MSSLHLHRSRISKCFVYICILLHILSRDFAGPICDSFVFLASFSYTLPHNATNNCYSVNMITNRTDNIAQHWFTLKSKKKEFQHSATGIHAVGEIPSRLLQSPSHSRGRICLFRLLEYHPAMVASCRGRHFNQSDVSFPVICTPPDEHSAPVPSRPVPDRTDSLPNCKNVVVLFQFVVVFFLLLCINIVIR